MHKSRVVAPAVAALAGRRIDAQDADSLRFPLEEAEHVAKKLHRHFRQEHVKLLICSAACGADILALEVAEKLAIPAIIVLPVAPPLFRKISVTDRPGNWGERFDRLLAEARDRSGLVELGLNASDEHIFSVTNQWIIQTALESGFHRKLAFVVWEGRSRGGDDSTAQFLNLARNHGFEKRSILTKRRGV